MIYNNHLLVPTNGGDTNGNNKTYGGFILLGFSEFPHLRLFFFSFILVAYIICLAGNFVIFMLITSQPQLHSPMYLMMANLAFVDVSFTSIIFPKALHGLLSGDMHISFRGCFTQLFLLIAIGNLDSFILAIMAFDRYAAVCFPLRYLVILNQKTCVSLLTFSLIVVSLHGTLYTVMTSVQSFCSWVIHHFSCDLPVIMALSCPDTTATVQMIVFTEGPIVIFSPILFILGSYVLIISAVLKLRSSQRRWKTFSTCSTHLTMVIMFYSTVLFMYFRPSSIYSPTYDRVISIVYTLIIPMLNPFIYSLRNKEIKAAVKKVLT